MPCEMESKCSKDLKLGSKLFHEYTICDQKYSQNLFFKLGSKGPEITKLESKGSPFLTKGQ